MNIFKIIKIMGIVTIFGFIMTFGSEIGERLSIPVAQDLMPDAEARVGRPLTPVSVAGVGRRTVRRCAAGVYNCKLPATRSSDGLLVRTSCQNLQPEAAPDRSGPAAG